MVENDCEENATIFLIIYIDENLTWGHHIAKINEIISIAFCSINQVKYTLPKDCLRTLYSQLTIYSCSNVSTTLGESCENVGTFLLMQHIPGKSQECCHIVAAKRCKKTSPQH